MLKIVDNVVPSPLEVVLLVAFFIFFLAAALGFLFFATLPFLLLFELCELFLEFFHLIFVVVILDNDSVQILHIECITKVVIIKQKQLTDAVV